MMFPCGAAIVACILATMVGIRGQTTYYGHYRVHVDSHDQVDSFPFMTAVFSGFYRFNVTAPIAFADPDTLCSLMADHTVARQHSILLSRWIYEDKCRREKSANADALGSVAAIVANCGGSGFLPLEMVDVTGGSSPDSIPTVSVACQTYHELWHLADVFGLQNITVQLSTFADSVAILSSSTSDVMPPPIDSLPDSRLSGGERVLWLVIGSCIFAVCCLSVGIYYRRRYQARTSLPPSKPSTSVELPYVPVNGSEPATVSDAPSGVVTEENSLATTATVVVVQLPNAPLDHTSSNNTNTTTTSTTSNNTIANAPQALA